VIELGRGRTPVMGPLVVLEDVLAVELFHVPKGGLDGVVGWVVSLLDGWRGGW
jgi:hypothetical protein